MLQEEVGDGQRYSLLPRTLPSRKYQSIMLDIAVKVMRVLKTLRFTVKGEEMRIGEVGEN